MITLNNRRGSTRKSTGRYEGMVLKNIVELVGVNAAYDGHCVLNDVCLEVQDGERIGIVGRNGAGKTTLFLVIMGLVRSLSGRINVCGFQTDNKKDLRELRKTVGIVFQKADDQLFSGTVFEDVAFGPLNQGMADEEIRRRVLKVLEDVGMVNRADRIGHHLSAGEKTAGGDCHCIGYGPPVAYSRRTDQRTGSRGAAGNYPVAQSF